MTDPSAQVRAARLFRGGVGSVASLPGRVALAFAVVAVAAAATGLLTGSVILTLAVGYGTTIVASIAAFRPFRDARYRRGVETYLAHQAGQRLEWRRATGASMPRSRAGFRSWLERHPGHPQAVVVLLAQGRLGEADALLQRHPARTPEEAFAAAHARAQRALLGHEAGSDRAALLDRASVDLERLVALWGEIQEPRGRRLAAQRLLVFEAQVAYACGQDPLVGFARSRERFGPPSRRFEFRVLLASWLLILAVVPLLFATLVGLGLG